MSKNSSLILNIVLVIAVAILYFLHFTQSPAAPAITAADSLANEKPFVAPPKDIKGSKIVYINSDVLNEKYEFVKDLTASAQARQQKLESAYQSKGQKLQQDVAEFQQKVQQGLLSENQATAAQDDLVKRKAELDGMESQLQALMDEIQKSNDEVRQNVVDYIKEYNKKGEYNYIMTYTDSPGGVILLANDSLDITKEILDGLNAQYEAKKAKKK